MKTLKANRLSHLAHGQEFPTPNQKKIYAQAEKTTAMKTPQVEAMNGKQAQWSMDEAGHIDAAYQIGLGQKWVAVESDAGVTALCHPESAALIVRAVNNHQALVEAAKKALALLGSGIGVGAAAGHDAVIILNDAIANATS